MGLGPTADLTTLFSFCTLDIVSELARGLAGFPCTMMVNMSVVHS